MVLQDVWSHDGSRRPQLSAAASLSASKCNIIIRNTHQPIVVVKGNGGIDCWPEAKAGEKYSLPNDISVVRAVVLD